MAADLLSLNCGFRATKGKHFDINAEHLNLRTFVLCKDQ